MDIKLDWKLNQKLQWNLLKMALLSKFFHLGSKNNLEPQFSHMINICVALLYENFKTMDFLPT
jgi:hypothetical protein